MKSQYAITLENLKACPKKWLVTGAAGFIGSNLVENLLKLNQAVVGLDNFATGFQKNLDEVQTHVKPEQWERFKFLEGDVRNLGDCRDACFGIDYVLHQAALGSVPRSVSDPVATNSANVTGFLNMLVAARDSQVKSFTYAASSSTYGDHPALPKVEDNIGRPLSPYAVTKLVNELYADVFAKCYGLNTIGLRYFNIFGKRQNPNGAYAAVIPKWVAALANGEAIYVNGDGESSRDFTFIENAIQANILAATAPKGAMNQVYNVAVGERTTLNVLLQLILREVRSRVAVKSAEPVYLDPRQADVRHSLADVSKAKQFLGYEPTHTLSQGIPLFCQSYFEGLGISK